MASKNNENDQKTPPLTAGEKVQVGWYVARMCKRGIAGEGVYQGDLEAKVDRVIDRARERAEKNAKRK
ncbi:hypothetical protein EDD98_0912 [Streptomyces sp. PanSC19]|uniref:DUF6257 family protein n=1 Tax=Streptomyces sp. PanSC19 TaxID=1520455 RepID=UPI000F49ADF1|nr:DUF6257 family protein [Streptomyces sp. PanSC19]ROQ31945.1 hypothetical protein EDD98_0912 [Streptomyces sp. PanSC19]